MITNRVRVNFCEEPLADTVFTDLTLFFPLVGLKVSDKSFPNT